MGDNTNKIAEKILSSIGLTVSDDAGVLAKARELAAEAKNAKDKRKKVHAQWDDGGSGALIHGAAELLATYHRKCDEIVDILSSPQPAPSTDDHPEPTAETRGDDRADLLAKIEKLEKFKAYVHKRLDDAGIPTHPDGPHSKEGCRVGDRLDIALAGRGDLIGKIAGVMETWRNKRDRNAWPGQFADGYRAIIDGMLNDLAFPSDPGEVLIATQALAERWAK